MNKDLTQVKNILSDLIQMDVLGGQSNLLIADYITSFLEARGVSVVKVYNEDRDKYFMHCRIGPPADSGVILSGHMDVVPVEGQPWTTSPFYLTESDGLWYGRGSCDMKGFLACCLASVERFTNAELKKPVYLAFSYDEEIGCLTGAEIASAIREGYNEKPAFAIIGEPSMMHPVTGHKGICVLETVINGSQGHSSRILSEVSAVHIAAELIRWLEEYMKSKVTLGKTDDRFSPNHTSIHVGMIKGGIAPNVIADSCRFQWDVRVIPSDNVKDILRDFELFCKKLKIEKRSLFPDFDIVTSELHPPVPPLITDSDADVVSFVSALSGNEPSGTVAYAAEAGQFAEAGFSTVICGPGDIAQAHRSDEYVAVSQIGQCMELMERLCVRLSE
jgi:acetylornithine deacetylase